MFGYHAYVLTVSLPTSTLIDKRCVPPIEQYKLGETSVHGKMTLSKQEEGVHGVGIKNSGGVEGERQSHVSPGLSFRHLSLVP